MNDMTLSAETPYLTELGLRAAPFLADADAVEFFDTPSRRRILDMALHVARHSDLVALISAPAGSGKSALLRAMVARAGTSVHPVVVAGKPSTDGPALLSALLQSFKLVAPDQQRDGQLQQVREQLEYLHRKGFHCVLFIDDADQITRDACGELETIANLRSDSGKSLLNLVLFARDPDRLPLHGPSLRHRLKRFALDAFEPNEVQEYLKYRLNAAGGHALYGQIFRERDIRRIIRESKGIPGAIDALAQQRLLRLVARRHPAAAPPDAPRLANRVQIAFATLFAIGLVSAFVFQDELTRVYESDQDAQVQSAPQEPAAAANGPTSTPAVAEALPVPDPIAEVVALVDAPPAPLPFIAPPAESAIDAPPQLAHTEFVPALQEPVQSAADTSTAPDSEPVTEAAAPVRQQDWLLEQNPAAYTVQIVGSPSEGDVRRALKKFDFNEVRATFTTQKKNQTWYGLVVGIYPDMDSAQQARAALPEVLEKRAWVRRVRSIQGEIKPLDNAPDEGPLTREATAAGH